MSKHFHNDMERVFHEILAMSSMIEDMIDKATSALCDRRIDLVNEVIESDKQIDRHEVQIEEECLKMLALHQPVAVDLRKIATILKVNNDLERIADLAVNVAERSRALGDFPQFGTPDKLRHMTTLATAMVRSALDTFVNLDAESAREVLLRDDEVDQLNVEIISQLQSIMQESNDKVVPALHCFSASRHIERIADHATNIAEDVIYLVDGDIVRHYAEQQKNAAS